MIKHTVRKAKRSHTTADECKFLNKIGSYSDNPMMDKIGYLKAYIAIAGKRSNWEAISKAEVLDHCYDLINKAEAIATVAVSNNTLTIKRAV